MLVSNTCLNKRYIINKPIFRNKNFISYLAFDEIIKTNIIIKELFPITLVNRCENNKNVLINSTKLKYFKLAKENYIEIFKTLQKFRANPSTIKIFSIFSENNTIYCVQEVPKGISLKKFLSNNYGELNWEQSKTIFLKLMHFLQNLHNYNIIHCGLSPETILVHNNNLKIIDFSNALYNFKKHILPQKLHDGYAPVEQYQSNLNIGTFTDVYSLAAIIYKSLTGTSPVNSTSRLLNDNLLPPKNLNPSIPKNISVSIMSALILSSKMRTQTVSDFCADLTAKSRDYYKNDYYNNHQKDKNIEIRQHINTLEPIKKKKTKEIKTRSIIFMAMLISSSVVLFTAAIIIFILFSGTF